MMAPLALILATATATAAPASADTLKALAAMDAALNRVAWRLTHDNVALCPSHQPATGLALHALEQYAPAYRSAAAQQFGLRGEPVVAAVAPGSPAEKAGVAVGDRLVAINGHASPAWTGTVQSYDRLARTLDAIDSALLKGPATLSLMRGDMPLTLAVHGADTCTSRFQLRFSKNANAGADGRIVTVDTSVMSFARSEDEIAAVVAHELAHNILEHGKKLDAQGVNRAAHFGADAKKIRATEVEADLFSIRLLANAGYRLEAAPDIWQRLDARFGPRFFGYQTHFGGKKRAALLYGEIARLRAVPAKEP